MIALAGDAPDVSFPYQHYSVGSEAVGTFPAGSEWAAFSAAGCEDTFIIKSWSAEPLAHTESYFGTVWFQARLSESPDIKGSCVEIQWIDRPLLALNDMRASITVLVGTHVTGIATTGAIFTQFESANCTGTAHTGMPSGTTMWSNDPGTISVRPYFQEYPNVTGDCLTITWTYDRPTLTILGETEEVTIPVRFSITPEFPDGALLTSFEGEGCTGEAIFGPSGQGVSITASDVGTFSYRAKWGHDDNSWGNCVNVRSVPISEPSSTADPVCGDNNDVVHLPETQFGVEVEDTGWIDNNRTISLTGTNGGPYFIDAPIVFDYTDNGPCETDPPVLPVHTEMCGTNNDLISFASEQPDHVVVNQSTDWSDAGEWSVTISAEDNYTLPNGTKTDYLFTDTATPCPTDAPAPPVQSAMCGPNNDVITIPDEQPEGISVDSDTGWENNSRIITFAVAPEFQTSGVTTFTFTDADDACPVQTMDVTILLDTSDDGSIAGSQWSVFDSSASQVPSTDPYMSGVVEDENRIVLEDILPGTYRLVVEADGYETLDEVLTMTDEAGSQTIILEMMAVQKPIGTPAPSPTAEPTQAVVDPTSAVAPVTGLPNTGSGSGFMSIAYVIGGLMILMSVGAITRRMRC